MGVGAAGNEEDDEVFEERLREIHLELTELNEAAIELAGGDCLKFWGVGNINYRQFK